jgi:putative ABC transport system permease protein
MWTSRIKLAFRVLGRRKVFTAISLVGITLTLSVLVLATALMDNTFAPTVPESRLDRMLFVRRAGRYGPHDSQTSNPGYGFLTRTVRNLPGAERVSFYDESATGVIYDGTRRVEAQLKHTDGEYWRILDFHFLEGGPYSAEDDAADRSVIVISDALRRQLFGGPPALGRTINVGGRPYRVVGVVPSPPVTREAAYSEMWAPIGTVNAEERVAFLGHYIGLVLARSRADIRPMQREFQARVARYPITNPKVYNVVRSGLDTSFEAFARNMTNNRRGDEAPLLVETVMAVAALLFMALPALNLITLNLSRILERASEIGVRKAFGAPRTALVTQFIIENVVLTLVGGAIGFIVAVGLLHAVDASGVFPDTQLQLNMRVFAGAMLLAAFFGILSGAYPAWKMARLNVVNALRGGAL